MSTQWIKRSEREPTQEVAPVVYGKYDGPRWTETSAQNVWHMALNTDYTHWRSIKADPPPRELTQREKDEVLARNIAMVDKSIVTECVLDAIYAERREVAKLLASYFCSADWGLATNSPALNSLRARLDELGGGK